MKAVGVIGPDFTPRLFDIDEPIAAPGGVVVEVMAASVNDFDRAAVEGRYAGLTGQPEPVLDGAVEPAGGDLEEEIGQLVPARGDDCRAARCLSTRLATP